MILRLLSAALAAGFLAALVATGLQLALTSPLILAAERYEAPAAHAAAPAALARVHAHAHDDHGAAPDAAPEWQPAPGLQRAAFTGLATLVGGVGYALLLGAALLACRREPTPETALAFALAGFASVALAPALGLPPELPGSEAAPLAARQAWWAMTAIGTALGLYLIAVRRALVTILGGLVLIAAPHVVGAPEVPHAASELPASLAALFAARSLAVSGVFWVALGLGYGLAWQVYGARPGAPARA